MGIVKSKTIMSTTDSRQMPRYKCHKVVQALQIKAIIRDGEGENRETDGSAMIVPMEEGYEPFKVDFDYMHRNKPQIGGFYVVHKDGCKSFSPAREFYDGYVSMDDPKRWIDRLLVEEKELEQKCIDLERFLNGPAIIERTKSNLMWIQLRAMQSYLMVLKARFYDVAFVASKAGSLESDKEPDCVPEKKHEPDLPTCQGPGASRDYSE